MKRLLLLLLAVSTLLAGCGGLYKTEYLSLSEHDAPYALRETTAAPTEETEPERPTASDYYGMRAILTDFVTEGVEHGEILLRDYSGNIEVDLKRVVRFLTTQDPVCAYATDYVSYERSESEGGWLIAFNMVFRRSTGEIAAIEPVRGNEAALKRMLNALTQQQSSLTLQVSGYTNEDFASLLQEYCLQHPDEIVDPPEFSVAVYPKTGNVRVVEVHYVYDNDRETLRGMRAEAQEVLNSAYSYIRYAKTDRIKLELLYFYLTSRFNYDEPAEDATVYSLLCQGKSNNRCMAAVVRYLCEKTDIPCSLVAGRKSGGPYYWNIIQVDGQYYHLDFQQDALEKVPLRFSYETELPHAYIWDVDAYPRCLPPDPDPETEPTEESAEATEDSSEDASS